MSVIVSLTEHSESDFEALQAYIARHGRVRRVLVFTHSVAAEMQAADLDALRRVFPHIRIEEDQPGSLEK